MYIKMGLDFRSPYVGVKESFLFIEESHNKGVFMNLH